MHQQIKSFRNEDVTFHAWSITCYSITKKIRTLSSHPRLLLLCYRHSIIPQSISIQLPPLSTIRQIVTVPPRWCRRRWCHGRIGRKSDRQVRTDRSNLRDSSIVIKSICWYVSWLVANRWYGLFRYGAFIVNYVIFWQLSFQLRLCSFAWRQNHQITVLVITVRFPPSYPSCLVVVMRK